MPEPAPAESRPVLLPAVTIGFAAAVGAWIVWLAIHLPAMLTGTGTPTLAGPSGVAFGATLFVVIAFGAWLNGPLRAWLVGLLAGTTAGLVLMLLLGSIVAKQPDSTDQMGTLANQFRANAPMIVAGFLAACAAGGAITGFLGGAIAGSLGSAIPSSSTLPAHPWLARLALTLAIAMLPLIILGGVVTSTESGLAVPDAVTSYGAVSVLFPLSLMAEPRIFFEHNHRLLGSLVGLTSIALMLLTMARARQCRWPGLGISLTLVAAGVIIRVFQSRGDIPPMPSAVLLVLLGVVALGFTHAMIARARLAPAAAGLFALVSIQGIYGIVRVGDQLTWMAAFHGVFAQAVLATAAMLVPVLSGFAGSLTADPARRTTRRLGLAALVVLSIQLVLGAITRHYGGSPIPISAHAAWSFFAVGMVLIVAMHCFNFDRSTPNGRVVVRFGWLLIAVVIAQFLLGWWALSEAKPWLDHRAIPLSQQLDTAHAIAIREALATTAHQTLGAILLALTTAIIASIRPANTTAC